MSLESRWENGDALPNLVSAMRLSRLYEISVEALFEGLLDIIRQEVDNPPTEKNANYPT